MDDTISYLANHNVHHINSVAGNSTVGATKYGMLWIDIEGTQVIHWLLFSSL